VNIAPSPRPAVRWRFPALLVALAAIWLTMLALGGGPLDQRIYKALYAGHRTVMVNIARFFTALGEPTVLIAAGVACALWLWWAGKRKLAVVLTMIVGLGRGLSEIQKMVIARPRPELEAHLTLVKTSSFPSGHSASSMIFFLSVALALTAGTRWHRLAAAGAILLSVCVGLSRVMLGVHWPSDVIGGWSCGMLWVLLTLRIAKRSLESPRVPDPTR
jgi:undecaprenyl-diphosphatase